MKNRISHEAIGARSRTRKNAQPLDTFEVGQNAEAGAIDQPVFYTHFQLVRGALCLFVGRVRRRQEPFAAGPGRYRRCPRCTFPDAALCAVLDRSRIYLHACDQTCTCSTTAKSCRRCAQIDAFNLFNEARANGAFMVAAGNHAADAAWCVREDLRTRIGWGLIYQVHGLTDEDKINAPWKKPPAATRLDAFRPAYYPI